MFAVKALLGAVYGEVCTDMAGRSHLDLGVVDGKRHLRRQGRIVNTDPAQDRHDKLAVDKPGLDNRRHCKFDVEKGPHPR